MEIKEDKNIIFFSGNEDQASIEALRDFLAQAGPEKIEVNLSECEHLSMAIVQLLGAYKALYEVEFVLANRNAYVLALESFSICENRSY